MPTPQEERKKRLDTYTGGVVLSVVRKSKELSAEFKISRQNAIASGLIKTTLEGSSDTSEDTEGWDEKKLKDEPFPVIEIPLQVTSATSLSIIVKYLQEQPFSTDKFVENIISTYGMNELINVIADANYLDIPSLAITICNYIGRKLNNENLNDMTKWMVPQINHKETEQDMKTELFLDQKDSKTSDAELNIIKSFQEAFPSRFSTVMFKDGRFFAITDPSITRSSLISLGNNYPYAYASFARANNVKEKYEEFYTENIRIFASKNVELRSQPSSTAEAAVPDKTEVVFGWFLPIESKDTIAELEQKSVTPYSTIAIHDSKATLDEIKEKTPKLLYLQYRSSSIPPLSSRYKLFGNNRSKNAPKSYLQKIAARLLMSYPQFPEVYLPQVLGNMDPMSVDTINLPEYIIPYYTEHKNVINLGRFVVIYDLSHLEEQYEREEEERLEPGNEEESLKEYFMKRANDYGMSMLYSDEIPFPVGIVIDTKPRKHSTTGDRFYKHWKLCCILRSKDIITNEYDGGDMSYPEKIEVISDTMIFSEIGQDNGTYLWVWDLENLDAWDDTSNKAMPYGDDILISHINVIINRDNHYGGITYPSPERKLLSNTYHYEGDEENQIISRSLKDNRIVRDVRLDLKDSDIFVNGGNKIDVHPHPIGNNYNKSNEYSVDIETLEPKIIDNIKPKINTSLNLPLINRRIVLNGYSGFVEIHR